jgi:hypothetical protein
MFAGASISKSQEAEVSGIRSGDFERADGAWLFARWALEMALEDFNNLG